MSWTENLQDATLDGVVFDVETTSESIERAVSVGERPYVDGGSPEDMGDRAMQLDIGCIFFGEDYEERLVAFLAVLKRRGARELVHPVFGSLKVQVLGRTINHSAERPDSCTVQVRFMEVLADDAVFAGQLPVQKSAAVTAAGQKAVASAADKAVSAVQTIREARPLAALADVRTAMVGPLMAGLEQAQGVIASGLDVLDEPRAWVTDMAAVTGGALDILSTDDNIQARWDGAVRVLDGIRASVAAELPGLAQMSGRDTPSEAQAAASTTAYTQVLLASNQASAAADLFTDEAVTPTLAPAEIEQILNTSREAINVALAACRAVYALADARPITEPLKDQASALQAAARAIIEARPPLIRYTLPASGNLRLVAHRLYADHTRALELARLNPQLRAPNQLRVGDVIDAYAI